MRYFSFPLLLVFMLVDFSFAIEFNWKPLMEPGSGGRLTSLIVSPHDSNRILCGGDMLGVGISVDRGESWQATFGFESWEMADFTWHPTDPQIVWVGSMSGPYKSEDGGVTWASKRKGMPSPQGYYTAPIERILFDPNKNQRLIAVGGSHRRWSSPGSPKWGAVWESLDAGESWAQIGNIKNRNIVAAGFAAESSDILYAAVDQSGAFISNDGGVSWEEMNNGLPSTTINWIEPHPSLPNVAFVAMGNYKPSDASTYAPGGIYKTNDYGHTWEAKVTGLAQNRDSNTNLTAKYETVVICTTHPDILFTGNTSWNNNNPYISKDGGEIWKSTAGSVVKCYPAGKSIECATIDPNNGDVILGAGSEFIVRTLDGGASWNDATAFQPEGSKQWRGRGFSGLVCQDFKWNLNDPNHAGFAAMDAGNFWHSQNNLYTWEKSKSPVGNWGGGNEICFSGNSTIFVGLGQSNFEGIARSIDKGGRWKVYAGVSAGLPEKYNSRKVTSIYSLPNDSSKVWAAIGGALYFSNTTGETWDIIFSDAQVNSLDGSRVNPAHIYLATKQGVYESTDGETFALIDGPRPATRVFADPHDENVVYATSWREQGGLWRYDGSQWRRIHNDKYIQAATIHPENRDIIAFVTDDHPYHDVSYATGVYLSEDGGNSWSRQNKGLAVLRGSCIAFNPFNGNQIVVGTGGRGYFVSGENDTKINVHSSAHTKSFQLFSSYPNPFNASTTLMFSINLPGHVRVTIFNLLGEQVSELYNGRSLPGEYVLQWKGLNDHGVHVPSGIYFVHLQMEDYYYSQKLTLMR
ncbi:T9SS type A sorting domain-containing protein [candidate division KSB1 bacterium]|nr:T9SS type A sorting domain-containing protein [candidate division KSB1 bacterium]